MNFYAFNIGDYAGATRHLSWDEDMAYRRMLDAYYSREQPLPLEPRQIYRLVGASEPRQREAVDVVLLEFFEQHGDGWHNNRADEEIAKTALKKDKARKSAAERWGNRAHTEGIANAPPNDANAQKGDANAERPQCEGNAPNPNPNPNSSRYGEVVARARDPDTELEHRLREAAGWQSEPSPNLAIIGPIQALIENGADLEFDVLPTIKAIAPQAQGRSWNYFVKAIARARDRRVEAATIVSPPTSPSRSSHAAHQQKPSRDETFAAIDRRIDEIRQAELREAGSSDEGDVQPLEGAA
jgi:uncharacterized protein YdaU (DUF1376 family)